MQSEYFVASDCSRELVYVRTKLQLADALTKAVESNFHSFLCVYIGDEFILVLNEGEC